MPEPISREMLAALPPRSMIVVTGPRDQLVRPYVCVRTAVEYGGSSTDGFALCGTTQWLQIAEWPDCEVEIIFHAGEADWPAMPPWASLVESITNTPSIGGGLQVSSAGAEALADQIYRDNGLEELLSS